MRKPEALTVAKVFDTFRLIAKVLSFLMYLHIMYLFFVDLFVCQSSLLFALSFWSPIQMLHLSFFDFISNELVIDFNNNILKGSDAFLSDSSY